MSTMTRNAYGLDTPRDTWREHMACRNRPPTWWDTRGERLSYINRVALGLCLFSCPVRERCEQDTRGVVFIGQIVAGYIHNDQGQRRFAGSGEPIYVSEDSL